MVTKLCPLDVELDKNIFFEYAYSFSLDQILRICANVMAEGYLVINKSLILEG